MTTRDAYLVGSVPLGRPMTVFTTIASLLGDRIPRVPDGEGGDRSTWILAQYPRLIASSAVEFGSLPPDGFVRRFSYEVPLRAKNGAAAGDVAFGDLGYANYAKASYEMFRTLKQLGKIPAQWRFQVNLPTPMDVLSVFESASRSVVEEAYERAMLDEVAKIQSIVPHDELAIAWDVVKGLLIWEDPEKTASYVEPWFPNPKAGVIDRYVRLGNAVAPDVELGYHLCYGDLNTTHAFQPKDLSACVHVTNETAARLQRPINFIHVPVPADRYDDAYFSPLRTLDTARVRHVYFGLIHYSEGVDGARRKIGAVEKYMSNFGVAAQCGLGRRPPDQIQRYLEMHAALTG